MASGLDEVSTLTEEMALVSTSKAQPYKEEKLVGKGLGCIATKSIKRGSLVLREAPQLVHPEITNDGSSFLKREDYEVCIKAFMEMSKEDQENYLKLHNKFKSNQSNWSSIMKQQHADLLELTNKMSLPNISQMRAFEVMAIKITNGFHNGVCLKMSRFNHSCRPNAQYFWNIDTNTRDVRALRKIEKGEEITLSYLPTYPYHPDDKSHSILMSREERRAFLKNNWIFDCGCEGCDATESEEEAKKMKKYKVELQRKKEYKNAADNAITFVVAQKYVQLESKALKNMYKIAREIKTFSRRTFLQVIVEEAFDVNAQGAASAVYSRKDESSWVEEAKTFAEMGLQMSKTLYGVDHSETKKWEERYADPIKYFKKEYGVTVAQKL